MTRTLRPRKSKPSYIALAGIELDDEGAGPSKRAVAFDDDVDSGSDFAPEKDPDAQAAEEDNEEDEDEEMEVDGEDDGPNAAPSISVTASRRSASVVEAKAKTVRGVFESALKPLDVEKKAMKGPSKPSLSRASKRQMYVLPTPSVHHRHRAVPLYTRTGRVERLETRPVLFHAPKIAMSNNFTQNAKVADRVNKSWGYNVGPGPIWELVEDRGWYKEAVEKVPDMDSDANRRPKVHKNMEVKAGWQVLSKSDAAAFLPTDVVITEDGNLKPPPPVTCLLGPFGQQTETKIEMFQSHDMAEFFPESSAYLFNAGAPVWGIDWCPIHADDRPVKLRTRAAHKFKQYLAVAPFPTSSHSPEIGVKVSRSSHACLQIWSLAPTPPSNSAPKAKGKEVDRGEMKCEMVLCIESGPAHELKWCPLPSHDDHSEKRRPRKLGLLSGVFEDGSWSVYVVPFPEDVRADGDLSQPVYVKLPEPLVRIELEETNCWTFDWANSEQIAIGTTNGIIAVYDLGPYLKAINTDTALISDILPTHYITVHQSAIRALAWIRAPPSTSTGAPRTDGDPTVIASGGYDGMECMTDIREGHGSVMNRTRDVINAMAFSPFGGGPVTIDHENIVKAYSASPSMLGRGHTLLEPQGPVWPFFIHKIYQLDYSRKSGVYRMLERFLPQETQDRPATKAKAAKAKATNDAAAIKEQERIKANSIGTGAWPREVGVHRVIWNSCNGLASSGLLASATASGLCRVDELWGRWIKGKVPYGGIEHIRRELDDDAMDVDGASDDSAVSSSRKAMSIFSNPSGKIDITGGNFSVIMGHSYDRAQFEDQAASKKAKPVAKITHLFKKTHALSAENFIPSQARFTQDGSHIVAVAGANSSVVIWDLGADGQQVTHQIIEGATYAKIAKISFDGSRVFLGPQATTYTADTSKDIVVWDTGSCSITHTVQTSELVTVVDVAMSQDGSRLMASSFDHMQIWDLQQRDDSRSKPVETHAGSISPIKFSPDGKRVVSVGEWDKAVKIWEVMGGETLEWESTLPKETGSLQHSVVTAMAVSNQGMIALGFENGELCITGVDRDVEDSPEMDPIRHADCITDIIFSADGERLAVSSVGGVVRMWSVATGLPISKELRSQTSVDAVALSSDERKLLAVERNGRVVVWELQ
ncbi:hypothetical protein DXG01_016497 [Tephrocybe rancida]|nr:hypothetical protein DXG01_016497 [Tephrocybe rancida]